MAFAEKQPVDFPGLASDPARLREASLAQHLGRDASYSAVEPGDLSDDELTSYVDGLSAQLERLEHENAEWHAAAVAEHRQARGDFETLIRRTIAELEPHSSGMDVEVRNTHDGNITGAILRLRDALRYYPSAPTKERVPGSLGAALDACRRELTTRQTRSATEIGKLKAQLSALGVDV